MNANNGLREGIQQSDEVSEDEKQSILAILDSVAKLDDITINHLIEVYKHNTDEYELFMFLLLSYERARRDGDLSE